MRSGVVPAILEIIANLFWINLLKRLDFPTLGRPTIAIIGNLFSAGILALL